MDNYESVKNSLAHHGMEKWDDLAKSNEKVLSELRSKYS